MDSFDWTLLKTFLAVAETGTFSGAGRNLKISQPTVGRHIQELEQQLGVTLFQRGVKGYDATENGLALLDEVRLMSESASRIQLKADGRSSSIKGTIRISTSEIIGFYYMPRLIVEMQAIQPELQVELVLNNSNDNLLMREADIAVRMAEPTTYKGRQAELIAKKITDIPLGVFGAATYFDTFGVPKSAQEMTDHKFIGYDKMTFLIDGMNDFGLKVTKSDFAIRSDSMPSALAVAQAGGGLVFGQIDLCKRLGLFQILDELDLGSLPCWLVAHQELRNTARVRFVFDFLATALKRDLLAR